MHQQKKKNRHRFISLETVSVLNGHGCHVRFRDSRPGHMDHMVFGGNPKDPLPKTTPQRRTDMPRDPTTPQLPRRRRVRTPRGRRQDRHDPEGLQQGPKLVQGPGRASEPAPENPRQGRPVEGHRQGRQGAGRKGRLDP